MLRWEQYTTERGDYIAPAIWDRDHWSTFAYLETLCVDNDGIVDNRRMRCNSRLHREFANIMFAQLHEGAAYPTRCKTGDVETPHDDWSCLEDMVAAGFVNALWRVKDDDAIFGGNECKVILTPMGLEVAARLRAHKARGGTFSTFEYKGKP